MENGNGVDRIVEDKALEMKGEEKVSVRSDESKDVEEEVFEEAVDTHDHSHDQGTKTESGNGVLNDGDSGSVVVDEGSNLGGEMESFEEAVEVLIEDGNVIVGEDKVEGFVDGERVDGVGVPDKIDEVGVPDKIDEGRTWKEVVTGELHKGIEVSGPDDTGKSEVLKLEVERNSDDVNGNFEDKVDGFVDVEERGDGVVVLDKIDEGGTSREAVTGELDEGTEVSETDDTGKSEVLKLETEKPDNGNSDDVNVEELLAESKSENGNASMVGEDREIGSSGQVLPEYAESEELRESELGAEYLYDKAAELVDTSAGIPMELLDDNGEKGNDNLASLNMEQSENASEELKEATRALGLENGNNMGEEVSNGILAKFETEHQNRQNEDAKDTSAGLDSEPSKETRELESTLAELHEAVVEGTVTQEIGSFPSLEKPTTEKNENVQIGTSDLRSESEPQRVVETVPEVHVVAKGPEMKEEKNRKISKALK
ncbi:hypothetical protein Dsin_026101 [Dipteronia sinensis]|uniref:Uncharacterized protein n=1 Tax=Dipteronia sinensis TaxID=43782 RepID=A0AAE0DXS9_9ROSI|nr:hypothetical protein Dsin_026101 [Dipteronia sinensis]